MRGLLAIEASQRQLGVALEGADGRVLVETPAGNHRERDLLLPAIDSLCKRAQLAPTELTAVAVSTGPGGFTGLRVAIATAKGICEALGIPAIDVPSALVAAHGAVEQGSVEAMGLVVALAAKGESCWASVIASGGEGGLVVVSEQSVDRGGFAALGARAVLADEHLPQAIRDWCDANGVRVIVPVFDPADCLAIGAQRLARGEECDPLALSPRYPREPEAVTLWRQRHGQ